MSSNDRSGQEFADVELAEEIAEASGDVELTPSPDAAYGPAGVWRGRPLRNMSEVRHFLRTNEVPIYFVGATPVQSARP